METKGGEVTAVTIATFLTSTHVGIGLSIGGNILISIALNVQKLAHNKLLDQTKRSSEDMSYTSSGSQVIENTSVNARHNYNEDKKSLQASDTNYLQSRIWWLGISLMILGELGNFIAYGFAPASTIAPLGTTTLVSNAILAPILLNERFRKRDFIGILLAIIGATGVVYSSKSKETDLSPELILQILTQTRSLLFYLITVIVICCLTVLSEFHSDETIFVNLGLVALYGSYTVLATKGVSSMLSITLYHMLRYKITYVLLLVLIISAVMQIKYLNRALQHFESTTVIPTQFVLFTISAIIGSAVVYKDFDQDDPVLLFWFIASCITEFFGVYLITSNRKNLENSKDDEEAPTLDKHSHIGSAQDEQNENDDESRPLLLSSVYDKKKINSLQIPSSSSIKPLSKRRSTLFRGISLSSQLASMEGDDATTLSSFEQHSKSVPNQKHMHLWTASNESQQ